MRIRETREVGYRRGETIWSVVERDTNVSGREPVSQLPKGVVEGGETTVAKVVKGVGP